MSRTSKERNAALDPLEEIEQALHNLERALRSGAAPTQTSALMLTLMVGLRLQAAADSIEDAASARRVMSLAARWQSIGAALDPAVPDDEEFRQ